MAGNVVRGVKGVLDAAFAGADKLGREAATFEQNISGKTAIEAADREKARAQKEQEERDAAQLLYDQQEENNKRQAAARARQKALNTGMGRTGTILTSPLGSAANQSAADMNAKTLLGS